MLFPPMTVGAEHIALRDFFQDCFAASAVAKAADELEFLLRSVAMVKIKNDRIALTAMSAFRS